MIFDFLLTVVWDGGIAAVFNSPFVIPVAGCVMVACIVVSSMWAGIRSQEIRSHERLAKIAQGLPVEPDWREAHARAAAEANGAASAGTSYQRANDGGAARRAGIVLFSVGVGLAGFFVMLAAITHTAGVLIPAAAGIIPLAIGIGFLVDARLKRREYDRHMEWERLSGGGMARGVVAGAVPPPPPEGMSAAQASDWRPLH